MGVDTKGLIEHIYYAIDNDLSNSSWYKTKCIEPGLSDDSILFLKFILNEQKDGEKLLVFIFIPLNLFKPKYDDCLVCHLTYKTFEEQCETQGYPHMQYDSIWKTIQERSYDCKYGPFQFEDNSLTDKKIPFILSLNDQLKFKGFLSSIKIGEYYLERVYQNLMEQNMITSLIQSAQIRKQQEIIKGKDKVIEYLMENLINLGGNTLINKWAPAGSLNYELIQRYDIPKIKPKINQKLIQEDVEVSINDYLELIRNPLVQKSVVITQSDPVPKDGNNDSDTMTQNKRIKKSFGRVKVSKNRDRR